MQLGVFTIYDVKAEAYHQPFFLKTNMLAIRTVTDMVNDPGNNLSAHPADYNLFRIALWDDNTATITMEKAAIDLGNLLELRDDEVFARREQIAQTNRFESR